MKWHFHLYLTYNIGRVIKTEEIQIGNSHKHKKGRELTPAEVQCHSL